MKDEKFVVYQDVTMAAWWPEKIQEAQKHSKRIKKDSGPNLKYWILDIIAKIYMVEVPSPNLRDKWDKLFPRN